MNPVPSGAPTTSTLPDDASSVGTLPTRRVRARHRIALADWRNLAAILLGWAILLVLLPPAHDYPVIDDWIYTDSVQTQLTSGRFLMHDQSQTSLVGQVLWGTLWSRLFGFSVTTLTFSTLALAIAGMLAFYALARRVGVSPNGALLATGLLALNPIWLHLSYSFMTDVPFLALSLVASYAYVRGLDGGHPAWLVLGGLVSGWAFLIRQFGVLVPAGFLAYLLLDALLTRRPRWVAILLVLAVPAAIVGWWLMWTAGWPETSAMRSADGWRSAFVGKLEWLEVVLMRALAILPLAGLCAPLMIRLPRRFLMPLVTLAAGLFVLAMAWPNTIQQTWVGQDEQPFQFTLGPLAFQLPQQSFTFGMDGSIVRVDGIDFYGYRQEIVWTPEVWRALFLVGTAMGLLLLVVMAVTLLQHAGKRKRRVRAPIPPVVGFYLGNLLICAVALAWAGQFFDRYLLGFLPAILLFSVRGAARWGRWAWGYAIGTLVVIGVFSVLLKADAMDHTNVRWQAGTWFQQRLAVAWGGYDWNRGSWMTDPAWQISDLPTPGYRTEATFIYTCRLCGWTTRYVYAQGKDNMPPLPPSPP